jgi:hypothetical protein
LTIWLSLTLTTAAARPSTFAFDVVIACLLETMVYGYFAFLIWRRPRPRVAGGFLPAVGVVLVAYAAVTALLVLGHGLLSPGSSKWYFIALAVESLIFLVVLGAVLVLNTHKTAEDRQRVDSSVRTLRLEDQLSEALHALTTEGAKFEANALHDTASALRRAKEKFAYSMPFGHVESAADVEGDIASEVSSLRDSLSRALTEAKADQAAVLTNVRRSADRILDLMARRDRIVVR